MQKKKLFQVLLHIILIIFALIMIYPILWTFVSSLKSDSEIFLNTCGLPENPVFENYVVAWKQSGLQRAFFNSVFVSLVTVVLVVVISLLAAYPLARIKSRITNIIFIVFLIAIMIPPDVTLIPMYFQLKSYNLINNLWGVILPSVALGIPMSVFILKQFIANLPQALIDSATIDGCSRFAILWKIITPLVRPALGSVAVFQFTNIWNSFMLPLIVLRKEELTLLPLKLNSFIGQYSIQYGQLFAAIMITFIPVVIFFVLFQRQFLQGMTQGAVKE